jgi:hypothetical protein
VLLLEDDFHENTEGVLVFCDLFGLMKLSETSQAFCSVKHLLGCSSLQSMNDKNHHKVWRFELLV